MMSRQIKITNPYGSSRATHVAAVFGKNPHQDAPAIERWQGKQIEHGQHYVEDQRIFQVRRQPLCAGGGQITDEVERQSRGHCERDVHGGSRCSDQHHVASWLAKRSKIDGHWFGITEQEWRMQQQQNARQQDRAEWIDVLQRIEADASKPPCGVVAKKMRDEAMRRFMKGDSEDHRDGPDRCQIDGVIGAHSSVPRSCLRR